MGGAGLIRSRVACIGTGTIGTGWAIAFARAGCRTKLFDASPVALARAREYIAARLRDLHDHGLIEAPGEILERIVVARSLSDAISDAEYVQESIIEDVSAKRELFEAMDAAAHPDSILASSTSQIPGSSFMLGLDGSARCMVAHPVNPPYLIPLVELCPTSVTRPEHVERCRRLLDAAGFKPIVLKKEICGFVLNRLQMALVAEALRLVDDGYCSAKDVDETLKSGLARRWVLMGPFETGHLNADGYVDYMTRFRSPIENIMRDLRPLTSWDVELLQRIEADVRSFSVFPDLEANRSRRDRELMALERYLRARTPSGQSGLTR